MKNLLFPVLFMLAGVHTIMAQGSKEITMLFAYTNNAACGAGGPKEIKANVENGLKLLNEALKNSNIGYTVRAVPEFVEVTYGSVPSDDDVRALLAELRKTDGKFNKVHQLRKQQQADMVCLIFSGYTMGLADLDGDMMVTHYKTFDNSYVFPHEFGHNLGATHEAGERFDFGGTTYRTVSNNGGVSIPYFSENRTITHTENGVTKSIKLGDASHDNASTMRKNAPKKATLGESLGNVAAVSGAVPAKLVNPATAPMPSGCEEAGAKVQGCNLSSKGKLTVFYSCNDATPIEIGFIDKDGNSLGGGKTSLKSGETKFEKEFNTEPGDKAVITVNGQKYECVNTDSPNPAGGGATTTRTTTPPPPPPAPAPTPPAKKPAPASTPNTTPKTESPGGTSSMAAGARLTEGQRMYSPDKSHYLVMQTDGNLCVYTSSDRLVWCSMATKGSGSRLEMQSDGNLVVYDRNNQAAWSTETHPYFDPRFQSGDYKPVRCALENDGTLCLYSASNKKVWSSKTGKLPGETASGSSTYRLEYVSGARQSYTGGGMPSAMVFKIKDTSAGTYVTDLRARGLTFEASANTDGQYDGAFDNLNNYCKNGDKACYGGYYYIPSNRGKSPFTLKVTVTLKKDGKTVDSYVVEHDIRG